MIKRFLKLSVTLLIILGVSFSNVPFYALTGLIDSYEKTSGIVDKIWLVQQNHDSDVVDRFASLRDVAEKMKIRQAKAATLTIVLNNRKTILTEGTSWTVPADWTSANNTIEVIGAGGSGFTDTTGIAGAGGGGGGAYSKITNLTLTPGATVTYQIGNGGKNAVLNGGDTFFNRTAGTAGTCVDTTSVCAKGGTGATSATGAIGGALASGTGATKYSGGAGGTGNTTSDSGGGGGGAGGPNVDGKIGGAGYTTAAGGGGGGGGGNGGSSSAVGAAGTATGGAGGAGNLGTGGGTGGSAANGGNGTTSGAGGGGGDSTFSGGNGFAGANLGGGVGPGGGGGGASTDATVGVGGNGGLYGAGGGGGRYAGKGAPGVIVITYNGLTPTKTQWTVPSDWDSANNTIEVIGAGGAAFSAAQGAGTSGGGGGAYSKATNVTLTPGAAVAYAIGNGGRKTVVGFGAGVAGGDTYLCNATTNCASIAGTAVIAGAKGGAAGVSSTAGGAGGAAASGIGATKWSGGAGGAGHATGDSGGGGGGAGGASQDGLAGGIGYTAASGGGGGGGGAGDDSGVNSTVGGAGVAANGGAGGQGPLGTGSGAAGANGSGGNATAGTGAGGGAGDAASVVGPFNGGDGATGSATTYGGGGGGGTGDSNLVATGALFGGEGGHYGGGGGAGLVPGFGGNGVIIITYTQLSASPTLTSYTNSTETGLNYATSCTGCGARIGGGAGFRQSVTITGTNFGADPGAANRSTATNNIKVGTHQIANSNVTAWANTSITFLTDSAIAGDTDTGWGTEYGGSAKLSVTAGGQAVATALNFYLFPQIVGITTNTGVTDGAREYDVGDTDGIIILNGTRFGSGTTGGSVTIFGSAATPVADAGCDATDGWAYECIKVQVPIAIADSTNTGNTIVTQGTGSNNKTHTYSTLRVLPRIDSLTPNTSEVGTSVAIAGTHLCDASCPAASTWNTTADDGTDVEWDTTDAVVTGTPSATAISATVPSISTGAHTVTVTYGGIPYVSNGKTHTIPTPNPNVPDLTVPRQFQDSGLTNSVGVGSYASSTSIYLTMTMSSGLTTGTLYPQIENKATGVAFTCTGGNGAAGANSCASAVEGTGKVASGNPWNCSTPASGCAVTISPADGDYHWQARVCRHDGVGTHTSSCGGTGDYASNWVSYGGNGDPSGIDFMKDVAPPVIATSPSANPSTNSAIITWTTDVLATRRVEYDTAGTFTNNYDCAGTSECTTIDTNPLTSHSVTISNLNSNTTYSYRVRSKDAAGNEVQGSTNTFITSGVTQPGKTTQTLIVSNIAAATTTYFTLVVPETLPAVKSAYVEVLGLVSGGTNPITVQFNGLTALDYAMNATNPTFVRILYKVADQNTSVTESLLNFNDDSPCTNHAGGVFCNKLIITPGSGMTLYVFSARFIMTYGYTP